MPIPKQDTRKALERQAKKWERTRKTPPSHEGWRPKVRADCATFPRPCPFVGCKYHLFLDANEAGLIKYNFGEDIEVLKTMADTCALDVAQRGPLHLEAIGQHLNVTRERARQQEEESLRKLRQAKACLPPEGLTLHESGYD